MAVDQWGDTIKAGNAALAGAMGEEQEPMLLLDVTGSMHYPNSAKGAATRIDVTQEALALVVGVLAAQDSQAAHEEEGGGLRTITFAGGSATDLGDLNPGNLHEKWASIRFQGSTEIMPGMGKVLEVYKEEFGDRPMTERPSLLLLVITDGEATDADALLHLIQTVSGNLWFEIALLGYGEEHDQLLQAYLQIASTNKHVRVTSFGEQTDPQTIADGLLSMLTA